MNPFSELSHQAVEQIAGIPHVVMTWLLRSMSFPRVNIPTPSLPKMEFPIYRLWSSADVPPPAPEKPFPPQPSHDIFTLLSLLVRHKGVIPPTTALDSETPTHSARFTFR